MMNKLFTYAAGLQNIGVHIARAAIVIVFLWIGGLNASIHKPVGHVRFVNQIPKVISHNQDTTVKDSPYTNDGDGHKAENMSVHPIDDTNSHALGALLMLIGLMIALYPLRPDVSAAGSFLAFLMSLVTLFFLVVTSGNWTTAGDDEQGFQHLNTAGVHLTTVIIMLGASMVTLTDAAEKYLKKKQKNG